VRRISGAVLVAAALVGVTVPALASTKPKPVKVVVRDDAFSPTKLRIKKGTEIVWDWSSQNYDSHNVTLHSGPRGVSKHAFTSRTGTIGLRFLKTPTVPGTYHFLCTIHPTDMTLTVVVTK
jgi:plastocyanin